MATASNPAVNEKEIKALLKQARDSINQKDHKAALNLCENIVKKDKTCYTAWIMISACAQELKQFNQAQYALNKAIELDENQPLAHQGFIQLGERAPDFLSTDDLISSYRKVCSVYRNSDKKKFADFAKKFIEFLKKILPNARDSTAHRIQICELCKELSEDRTIDLNQEEERSFRLLTVDLIANAKNLPMPLKEYLSDSYFWLSQINADDGERQNLYEKYLRSLCEMKKAASDIIDYSNECLKLFPKSSVARDAMLWVRLESLVPEIFDRLSGVGKLTDALNIVPSSNEQSPSALFICAKAFFLIRNRKFTEALELLLKAEETNDGFFLVLLLKTVCFAELHSIDSTLEILPIARSKLSEAIAKDFPVQAEALLDLCLAMATFDQGKSQKSIEIFEKVLRSENKFHVRAITGQFNGFLNLNRVEEARNCYERVQTRLDENEDLSFRLQLSFVDDHPVDLLKTFHAAKQQAEEEEQTFDLNLQGWLTVGRAYLAIQRSNDMFDKHECKRAFEKAIEIDPFFWQTFAFLSQFYEEIEQSLPEAMACSKRAFQLNQYIESVQIRYVDHLLQANQIAEASEILQDLIEKDNMKTWAQFRLGLISIRLKNVFQAVKILQIVSRRPPVSGATWSALGDAHFYTNNLKTALNCYRKASELESETLYSATREAFALTLLGRYEEAIRRFDQVLDRSPKYLLARKGKGEAYFYLSMEQIGAYKDEAAVQSVQQALTAFHDALCLEPNFSSIWKKYGDACMILHPIDEKLVKIRLPVLSKKLDENKIKDAQGCVELKKEEILQRAEKCFMQAIRLKPRSPLYWSSLSNCLYLQARLKSNEQKLLKLSFDYAKIALSLKPTDHLLWNSLGVIAANPVLREFGFAQHCFLKSLEIRRSPVAFANLGLLYFQNDNLDLANRAFSNGQQTDPNYPISWIGQAMIAEKLDYDESLDLYRHSVELSNHSQSLFCYGKMVAKLLVDPSKRNSEVYRYGINYLTGNERAGDALTKFIQRNPNDSNGLECLGIIHEFNKRFNLAAEAFRRSFSELDAQSDSSKRIRNDFARNLCRAGKPKTEYFSIENSSAVILDVLWLTLSYGKLNQRAKGVEILKTFAEKDGISNENRSILLTFLGLFQRKIDEQAAVKTIFKSYSTKPTCPNAVTALCAMGMIIGDARISAAAIKEMPKLNDTTYNSDVHGLTCFSLLATKKFSELYSLAMNAVLLSPWSPSNWVFAAFARLQTGKSNGVLDLIEPIFRTNFSSIDEKIVVLVGSILQRISSERHDRIVRLFQILILHFPTLIEIRTSLSRYIQLFDQDFGRSISTEKL